MIPSRILQSWAVPVVFGGAYAILMWSSGTSNTGKAWMAIGFAFVFVLWWMFRLLTQHAALSRAVSHGDAAMVIELTDAQLRKRKSPSGRAPFLVYRALAYELTGDWAKALATLDEAKLDAVAAASRATWQLLAASVRVTALVETGKLEDARGVLTTELMPAAAKLDGRLHSSSHLFKKLAAARILVADQKPAEARLLLQGILDDIRAGSGIRATAHFLMARISEPAEAAQHRAEIAKLVPDPTVWVRTAT